MLRNPPPLAPPNDKIVVVAPAGPVEENALDAGLAWLAKRYVAVSGKQNLACDGYLAGVDQVRLQAFQAAIDDAEAKAVVAARGGYGTTRILDQLSFRQLHQAPKWIVGSSDLTAVLIRLYAEYAMPSIHGPMVFRYATAHDDDLRALVDMLEGRPWTPPSDLGALVDGEAEGPLIGGNLTVLAHMAGTLALDFADGAVLFLEDVGERPYRLDRCLTQLKRAGMLKRVCGFVLGEFADCNPGPDGVTVEEVMARNLAPLGVPIVTRYPAAHGRRNYPFLHGGNVALNGEGNKGSMARR